MIRFDCIPKIYFTSILSGSSMDLISIFLSFMVDRGTVSVPKYLPDSITGLFWVNVLVGLQKNSTAVLRVCKNQRPSLTSHI
jgi:hypothetical protein